MMKLVFSAPGMSCGHCKARVEKALAAAGFKDGVLVNLDDKTVTVESNAAGGNDASAEKLAAIITDAGYPATLI